MQKNIDIVISMAGCGSRFRNVGYSVPKYMIEIKGKTLFEWSLSSLENFNNQVNRYIFVALKDEFIDVVDFVSKQCQKLNINNYELIIIERVTDGQATTVMLAEKYWNEQNALLIYNIDTYVESGEITIPDLNCDGFIPCFCAEGSHWSFVLTDENNKAIEVREKQRISDNCTIGAYYFKTVALYKKLYEEYYKEGYNLVNGEKFVAPLYNLLIRNGGDVFISNIPTEKVHVLGTPKELKEFEK